MSTICYPLQICLNQKPLHGVNENKKSSKKDDKKNGNGNNGNGKNDKK